MGVASGEFQCDFQCLSLLVEGMSLSRSPLFGASHPQCRLSVANGHFSSVCLPGHPLCAECTLKLVSCSREF